MFPGRNREGEEKERENGEQIKPKERELKDTLVIDYSIDNKKKKKDRQKKERVMTILKKPPLEETTAVFPRAYSLSTKLAMQILRGQCLPIRVINCLQY